MKKSSREKQIDKDPLAVEVRDEWMKTARSVDLSSPSKHDVVLDLVKRLYVARGWKPPADACVISSPSPFVTMVTAGLLTLYEASRQTGRTLFKQPSDESQLSRIRGFVSQKTANNGRVLVYEPVSSFCRKLRLLIVCSYDVATDLLATVVTSDDKMLDTLAATVQSPKVLEAVTKICRSLAGDDLVNFSPSSVVYEIGLRDAITIMGKTLDVMEAGNLNCGISSFVDYLDRQKAASLLKKDIKLRAQISSLVGPWVMHPRFCIVGEFPDILKVNDSGQLHSEDGPACRWSDDTRIYCLKGVQVGSRFVEDPESATVTHLEKMNIAQRAACFDKIPKREQVLFAIHEMEDKKD